MSDAQDERAELFAHDDGDGIWFLSRGSYSSYGTIAAFPNREAALAFHDVLDQQITSHDEAVEFLPYIGSDVRVITVTTIARGTVAIKWNGNIGQDTGVDTFSYGAVASEEEPEPHTHYSAYVRGDEWKLVGPCDVSLSAYETGYTLGVALEVVGTDIERVRKVYSEQRAQLLAEPAVHTVRAWANRDHPLPSWVWTRDENRPLLDALRQAGVQ